MKTEPNFYYKGLFIIYHLLTCNCSLFSQCFSSPKSWMNAIVLNETETTQAIPDKLKQLLQFEQRYLTCKGVKDSVYARILHRLGDYYIREGDFEKGILFTKNAILINQSGNPGSQKKFLTNSFYNLGYYYSLLNDVRSSITYYDSCVLASRYFPEKEAIALDAIEKIAFSYFFLGDYEKSIEVAAQGILFSNQSQPSLQAALFIQMAQSQVELNQTEKAEKSIKNALVLMPSSETGSASLNFVYASFYKSKKEFKTAIAYYNKALEQHIRNGNWVMCSNCLINIGVCYDECLNQREAMESYKRAIEIQKVKDNNKLANVYNNIGSVHWKQKEYLNALYYFQSGLNTLFADFKDSSLQSNPPVSMLKYSSNEYYAYTLLANKGETLLDLYKTAADKKHLTYALAAFRIADQLVGQMRRNQFGNQSKLFWRERTKKMYAHAIETCYLLDDKENAFFFFEKSRAALLSDKLNELGAKKYLTQQEQHKEESLFIRLFSLHQKLIQVTEKSLIYKDIKQEHLRVRDSLEKFRTAIAHSNPAYYRYKYDTTVYTIQDVRSKLLKSDRSLIDYFNSDSCIYIFCITPYTTTFKQIHFKDYANEVQELLHYCSNKSLLNRNYSVYRKLSSKFYKLIYKPLAVPTKRVIISPDGDFIPFDLLLKDSTDDSSFLLKDAAFSYTYSATFLIKNQKEIRSSNNSFLGIAPEHYQPHLKQQPLINSEQSLTKIAPYFSTATLLINEHATKKQFLNHLATHTIIQLYTHADADNTDKEPLIYFSDSSLNSSEFQFFRNKITTRLMILSACNTAVGKNMEGEGVFSFARGIVAAGIPSTVATLWPVDNQSTYQLTEFFHKYLSEGIPADQALQKAKIEFLDNADVAKQLPYFWASTILIGETDILSKKIRYEVAVNYAILITLLSLLLTLVIGFKIRRKNKLKNTVSLT